MTGAVKPDGGDSVRGMVHDMEDCITRAEYYTATIGTLIEYIPTPIPEIENVLLEQAQNTKASMYLVQQDLEQAVIEARRRWREIDAATKAEGGAA